MGDIIMTTPTVRCLRKAFPKSEIHFVVRKDFKDLITLNPYIDKVFVLSREEGILGLIRLIKKLNRERYDLIYDMHLSLRSLIMTPFLKAEKKLRFQKNYIRRSIALTFKFPKLKDKTRMLQRFIKPLSELGVTYDGLGPQTFYTKSKKVEELFNNFITSKEDFLIGIVASANWPGKRWPVKNFKLLIKEIQKIQAKCVVFGGPSDDFCKELSSDGVLMLQGLLTLQEAIYAISFCNIVIANDTGLMHIADSLNKPTIVIMGPTSGELGSLPFNPNSIIIEKKMWCRPCSKNGQAPCIRLKRQCLNTISVNEVMDVLIFLKSKLNSN